MSISGFSHASIQVTDMDRSLEFYRDLLGLSILLDRTEKRETTTEDGGTFNIHRRAVYLRWDGTSGNSFVVLGQKFAQDTVAQHAGGLFGRGIDHVGLWVDDLDPFVARAADAGAEILHGPAVYCGDYYGENEAVLIKTVMFLDPDGTVIQLDQRLASE